MTQRLSYLAIASALLGALAGVLALLGPGLASQGIVTPMAGFQSFGLGLLLGTLTLVLGGVALWRTRASSGRTGRAGALFSTAVGLVLAVLGVTLALPSRSVPPINDITTSTDDPPRLEAAARQVENQGRDLSYAGEEFARQQREAYPDLVPVELDRAPERAFADALGVVRALGWTLTAADEETRVIEAYQVSGVFRFVDDVVIRVRPSASGAVVDMRSKSRDGRSDLGANAARIRTFVAALRGLDS